jgi:hypothetical protein
MSEGGPSPFSRQDLAAAAALGLVWLWTQHWIPQLPPRIPSHWDAAGRVNGWITPGDLFHIPFWAATGAWFLLFLIGLALRNQPRASSLIAFRGWLAAGLALMTGYLGPMAAIQGQGAVLPALGLLAACLIIGLIQAVRAVRREA